MCRGGELLEGGEGSKLEEEEVLIEKDGDTFEVPVIGFSLTLNKEMEGIGNVLRLGVESVADYGGGEIY